MKRSLLIVSVFIFSSLMVFNLAQAASSGSARKAFGGKITEKPSLEIQTLEDAGYKCQGGEDTFDIKPAGKSPIGPYYVGGTKPKTKFPAPRVNQWVLGRYEIITVTITCINEDPEIPPVEVQAKDVTLWGTSK